MSKKKMYILRGISGSGKSTLASKIIDESIARGEMCATASTDNYFVNRATKEYVFDASKLGVNHKKNISATREIAALGADNIIIDNTNTTWWEIEPYALIAKNYDYEVHILEPTTEWAFNAEILAKKNIHGVPMEAIKRMLARFESSEKIVQYLKKLNISGSFQNTKF
jgi:adenylate kinase family enzyme